MEGTSGILMADTYGANPRLIPTVLMEDLDVPTTLARVTTNHEMDWIQGIKDGYQPSSHLLKAGPLTETVLMGNLAIRAYNQRYPNLAAGPNEYRIPGRTKLLWDGETMTITNVPEVNEFVRRSTRRAY